jgi:hypothetical protein
VRIVFATAAALVLAVPLNLAIEAFARQVFDVSPEFVPFQGTVGPYTAGGVILAGVAFAVLRRVVRDTDRVYIRVAIVALMLSWIPDLALLVFQDPGATAPAVASLMVMHALTAATVVTLLVRIAGSSEPTSRTAGRRSGS